MWCVAELTPEYIQKMEDTLGIYEKPYDPAQPAVCLDEKPISLHDDVRPPIPAKPGKPAKQDNEYERCGTANVFAVVEPKSGRHFTTATPQVADRLLRRTGGRLSLESAEGPLHSQAWKLAQPSGDRTEPVLANCGSGEAEAGNQDLERQGQPETDQDQLAVHA